LLTISGCGGIFKGIPRHCRLLFLILAALLVASHLCHVGILWEGDAYPLAAARQMLYGKALYRDIWFDKPPLMPAIYLLLGALPGWPLRLAGALYALVACWIAYSFARGLWSQREGVWAAALLGFFLIFDIPSAVIPVASDLLMLAPHLAAVWLAWRRWAFWSGVAVAVAFWINPKGLLVAAVCVLWYPAGIWMLAAGFAAASGVAVAWLWAAGALAAYGDEVWRWGRLYAGSPLVERPMANGIARTLNWAGYHAAAIVAVAWLWVGREPRERAAIWPWLAWLILSLIGVAAGLRFFPRYYFLLLPVIVLMAARGFCLLGQWQILATLLLLIPAVRFGPSYVAALTNAEWRDTAMDRDSRAASALLRQMAKPGDTLFVWGYRPEIYVYTRLPAASVFLDSQPLTGVPADRHLTHSEAVESGQPAQRRIDLTRSSPAFIVDGLGSYNPRLAITNYPDLRGWLGQYEVAGRSPGAVIYTRR